MREFLTTRRERITPEQAGLPAYGGARRRVKGLRREEVALLAGISVEYYTRLERGNVTGVSESVLQGISRALQLDEAERAHLDALVRSANTNTPRRRAPQVRVRPGVQRILDAITEAPAFILNARLDVLAANALGHAFYSELFADPTRPVNTARFVFLNPQAPDFFVDWDSAAADTVGILRAEAGRDPYDRRLSDLIGELSTRSDDFRVRWATHNVKLHRSTTKRIHHPLVGDLTLDFESLDLPGDPGQTLNVYTPQPNSPSHEALNLLASWTSTHHVSPVVDPSEHNEPRPQS